MMKKIQTLCFIALWLPCSQSLSALLNLSTGPLLISNSAKPNIFFMLDDSGSMDWESLINSAVWEACAYDPNSGGSYKSTACGSQSLDGIQRSYGGSGYRNFVYLYKASDNKYSYACNDPSYNAIEACPEAGTADWRIFSSDVNVIYYNPDADYLPWRSQCQIGIPCANASFTAVRSNPKQGTLGYSVTRNLGSSVLMTGITGFPYTVWIDDKGYTGTRPTRGVNVNYVATPNGAADLWDSHIRIVLSATNAKIYKNTYSPTTLSINPTSVLAATLSDTSACYNVLGGSALVKQIFNGTLGYTSTGLEGCKTLGSAKQDIANWYQYARRRSLAAKGAIDTVIYNFPDFRYGLSVINNFSSLFVEMPSSTTIDFTTQNATLLSALTSYEWQALGTPLLTGLEMAGQYYAGQLSGRSTSPITASCQQNFSLLLTDGYWNGANPSTVKSDVDLDGYKVTLADVARYYYLTDLSSLPNDVLPNPFDPATYQHMVTFTISFGQQGNLIDTDNDGWPNPVLKENGNWGDPTTSDPAKIDDLWHAAFNSKGSYSASQSPDDLKNTLTTSFNNITARVGSVVGVAQNSSVLQTNSAIYRAQFDSQSWAGSLLAYPISLNGTIAAIPSWNAGCILTGGACTLPLASSPQNPGILPSSRVIITSDFKKGSRIGIPFRWPSNYSSLKVSGALPTPIANLLQFAPYPANTTNSSQITANQSYGQNLIDYFRGERSQEIQNRGSRSFRNRKSILGDFVNSQPLYISPPGRFYSDTFESVPYSAFKTQYQNRVPLIAVGANDGMMHLFNANTGREMLAYVPGIRDIPLRLPLLSKSTYTHVYFVDGAPTEADVVTNNSWQTILASGLGNGGQGIFALNITDPSTFSEANAANILLWEFRDEDDFDLGYVNGKVQIAKVRAPGGGSKWAAIFGNGYNNTQADGFVSTTGKAALYIAFLDHGLDDVWTLDTDYIKVLVGSTNIATPNGLAEPYLVDIDGDQIVDYVYAGDLLGNLWKFDLRSTTPANWKTTASVLFNAKFATVGDQPITSPPIARFHPNGPSQGILVYFGTGQFLTPNDNSATGQVTQSFYAIWDKLDGSVPAKSQLLQQSIVNEITQSDIQLRQITNYAINWSTPNPHLGWYINLQSASNSTNAGERQISQALLRGANVIFSTLLPSPSPCSVGGSSWLMELDTNSGGAPKAAPFDLNQDGIFDKSDYIIKDANGNTISVIPGGRKSTVGAALTPSVFLTPDKSKEIKVISGSTGLSTISENPGKGASSRQSWRILN